MRVTQREKAYVDFWFNSIWFCFEVTKNNNKKKVVEEEENNENTTTEINWTYAAATKTTIGQFVASLRFEDKSGSTIHNLQQHQQ